MSDLEGQLNEEVRRGAKANSAYEDFFKPFIDSRRKTIFEAFSLTPVEDIEGLQRTRLMLLALDALESDMVTYIETGKMAELQLSQLTEKLKNKH